MKYALVLGFKKILKKAYIKHLCILLEYFELVCFKAKIGPPPAHDISFT